MSNDLQKIVNFKHALEFLESKSQYPVELGGLLQYNAMVGYNDLTHANPGCIRIDKEVTISHCLYTIPPVSDEEALQIVNGYWDFNDVYDQCAYLAIVLPKAQVFYNGNKRTSLLACNQLLCYNNAQCIFMLDTQEKYDQYITMLLSFYNGEITQQEAMEQAKWFIA